MAAVCGWADQLAMVDALLADPLHDSLRSTLSNYRDLLRELLDDDPVTE